MYDFPRYLRPLAASQNPSSDRNKAAFPIRSALVFVLLLLLQSAFFLVKVHAHEAASVPAYILDEFGTETVSTPETGAYPPLADDADEFNELDDEDDWTGSTDIEDDDSVIGDAPRLRGGVFESLPPSSAAIAVGGSAPMTNHSVQLSFHIAPQIVTERSGLSAEDYLPSSAVFITDNPAPVRGAKEVKVKSEGAEAGLPGSITSSFAPALPSLVEATRKAGISSLLPDSVPFPRKENPSGLQKPLPVPLSSASTLVNNPLDVLHTLSRGVSSLPSNVVASLPDFGNVLRSKGAVSGGKLATGGATTPPTVAGAPGGNFITDLLPATKTALHSMLPGSSNPAAEDGGIKQALVVATGLVGRGTSVIPEVGAAAAQLLSTAGGALSGKAAGLQMLGKGTGLMAEENGLFTNAQQLLNKGGVVAHNGVRHPPLSPPSLGESQLPPAAAGARDNILSGDGKLLSPGLAGRLVGEGGLLDPSALGQKIVGENSLLDINKMLSDSTKLVEETGLLDPKLLPNSKLIGEGGLLDGKVLPETKLLGEGDLLDSNLLADTKVVGEGGFLDPKRIGEAASTLLDPKGLTEGGLFSASLPGDATSSGERKSSALDSPVLGEDGLTSNQEKILGGNAGFLHKLISNKRLGGGAIYDSSLLGELALLDPKLLRALFGPNGSAETLRVDARLVENLKKLDSKVLEDLNLLSPKFLENLRLVEPKFLEMLQSLRVVDSTLLQNLSLLDSKLLESLKLVDPTLLERLILVDPTLLAKLTDPGLHSTLNFSDFTPAEISNILTSILENDVLTNFSSDVTNQLLGEDNSVASLLQRSNSNAASPPSFSPPPSIHASTPSPQRTAPRSEDGAQGLAQFFSRGGTRARK